MNEETRQRLLNLVNSLEKETYHTKDFLDNGHSYEEIMELIKENILTQCDRGTYVLSDSTIPYDEMALLQNHYPMGIYSNETALYLHGYSERAPLYYVETFPKGYNSPSLKEKNVKIKRSVDPIYSLGQVNVLTPYGNSVIAYDLERTLCDILRDKSTDKQLIKEAYFHYMNEESRDLDKLLFYASKLHVVDKVRQYIEVLG